jgi:3-phenylpropionate/trans-cinnamate dioxygenase ferredoxin reductase subunit
MTSDRNGVVIVGGGQAGFSAALALRGRGYNNSIRIICGEGEFPYQRPPLSKSFLVEDSEPSSLWLAAPDEFERSQVDIELGVVVEDLTVSDQRIRLDSGQSLAYDHLVLATGARNRQLSLACPHGVYTIRTSADASLFRAQLGTATRIAITGAGLIGMEVAGICARLGMSVDVVEGGARPMNRLLSAEMAAVLQKLAESNGVRFHFGDTPIEFLGSAGRLVGVRLASGVILDTDLALVSIGVAPRTELVERFDIPTCDGIPVDSMLRTSMPHVFAIGDCASFPVPGLDQRIRLESVQNALDQGDFAAAVITGARRGYSRTPWFWSEQHGSRLQIAGLIAGYDQSIVVREFGDSLRLSVYCFRGDRLVGVESLNRPADHLAARHAFDSGTLPGPGDIQVGSFDFRTWLS